ncbi:MAG: nicotinamide riboside transporter PnuC [Bacteroidia bacterium]
MSTQEVLREISTALSKTSVTEWLILISALLYIFLVALENSWGWLFGIIASALSVFLCYSGNLFLESGLNVFYVIIGVYGWHQWLYGSKEKAELPITKLSLNNNLVLVLLGGVLWIPFGYFAGKYSTQALPYMDAFITAFSIIATYMTAKKYIENWIYWIITDSLGIFLFGIRGFYLLALLNIVYTILALAGFLSWRKKILLSALR